MLTFIYAFLVVKFLVKQSGVGRTSRPILAVIRNLFTQESLRKTKGGHAVVQCPVYLSNNVLVLIG